MKFISEIFMILDYNTFTLNLQRFIMENSKDALEEQSMKRYLTLLLALAMLLCAGCKSEAEEPLDVTPEAPDVNYDAPEQPSQPPEEVFEYYNPLTGEGMHKDISMNRPVAIMINNIIQAQPQCGVSNADIIFELPAEGGVTRMLAVFQDLKDIESIGSIRSLRAYYLKLAQSLDAILVHAGGSDEAYLDLRSTRWDHIDGVMGNYSVDPFYRDKSRMQYGTEHSLFATGNGLIDCIEDKGFRLEHEDGFDYGYTFSEAAGEQCTETAEYVKVIFNSGKNTSFTYDSETGLYTGYQFGSMYQDGSTEEPMTFTNLVLMSTKMSVYDGKGRLSVELNGTGSGYFVNGGHYTEINWSRDGDEGFRFTLADGTPVDLGIGKSYIAIYDQSSGSVEFEKT